MRAILVLVFASIFGLGALSAYAAEPKTKTIAALYQEKTALAGKEVSVKGKVVKVNNGIMERNFLHIQDGTGDKTTNDLTVTSKQTAKIGDQVSVSGRVVVNKDFGAGYAYSLMLEEASITVIK